MDDVRHIFVIGRLIVKDGNGLDFIIVYYELRKCLGNMLYFFMVCYPVVDGDL